MQFRSGFACASILALGMAACVTINIYFPAAAAEKAADRIIDEVWQIRKEASPAKADEQPRKEEK